MKNPLFLIAFFVFASVATQAATIVVTFGQQQSGSGSLGEMTGTYRGESGTVNYIKCSDNGGSYTTGVLKDFAGQGTDITLVTGGGTCGRYGVFPDAGFEEAQGDGFSGIFGMDMVSGSNYGGVVNSKSNYTLQLQHLAAGAYTLTMLVGRGNTANGFGATATYNLDGTGISDVSANLLDCSTTANASLDGATLTATTNDKRWALVEYSFTVTENNSTLNLAVTGGSGDINALALSSVPEPATASLSLLGLAVLVMRRRRA